MKSLNLLLKLILLSSLMQSCASSSDVEKDPDNLEAQHIETSAPTKIVSPQVSEAQVAEMNKKNNKDNVKSIETKNLGSSKLSDAIASGDENKIKNVTTELLLQNPKDVTALNALGLTYYQRGNYDAALYLFDKAIQAQPNSADVYNNVGLAKLALGEQRQAILAFRKGLELNLNHPTISSNLGAIYLKNHDYIKAEVVLEKAVNAGSKDAALLNNYAIVLMSKNENDKAKDIFEKLTKDNSNQANIMLNYASLLIEKLNKPKEGLDILNRLKFVGTSTEYRNMIKDLETEAKAGLK